MYLESTTITSIGIESNDVLRGRHGPIPAIRARLTDPTDARRARTQSFCRYRCQSRSQPRRSRSNRPRARWHFCWARTRMLCGRRCARTSQAGWSRLRSGSRMRSRARGRRSWSRARRTSSGLCADVALFVCSGRARGCDAVVEHSSVGTHVRVKCVRNLVSSLLLGAVVPRVLRDTYDTAEKKARGGRRRSTRSLIIETICTYHHSERAHVKGL